MVHWEKAPWLVSIRRLHDRPPNGAGVLVTDRHVLTCAHVTIANKRWQPPEGPVFVQFQHDETRTLLRAVVIEGGWHPQDSVLRTGDLAVLELLDPLPESARTAPLVSAEGKLWKHEFHVYGYPEGDHKTGGVSASGVIQGRAATDWIQLEAASERGHTLAPGFSGTPVWDITLGGVIGIVAARDRPGERHDPRTGFAIPVDALAGFWPLLRQLIRQPVPEDRRARIETLLALPLRPDGELPRVSDVPIYDIGVTRSKDLARDPNPPYVPRRREDRQLDEALESQPFILLAGDSKAGKSRTLIELLRRRLPDARLIVPKDTPSAPGELAELLPLPTGQDPAVLWLDDIQDYLRPGGVDLQVLEAFARHQPPVTVVATITSKAYSRLRTPKGEVNRAAGQVLRVEPIVLSRLLREEDRAEAQRRYPHEDFTDRGIGEQMVAAPLIEGRFNGGREECPEGWAVVRAAVDWQRMGCEAPLTETALRELFVPYLAAGPSHRAATDTAFSTGVDWATETVAGSIALLSEYAAQGECHYQAFPYLPGYVDGRGDPETVAVPEFAWGLAMRHLPPNDLLGIAFAAFTREEPDVAVDALERAHSSNTAPSVTAWAALILGDAALRRQEMPRAKELFEEALRSDSPDVVPLAQVNLAGLLHLLGDDDGALEILEQALVSGDPQAIPLAQASLGGLLINQGELDRARELLESAMRASDPQIAPIAAANLAGLIVQRGELAGAQLPSQCKLAPSAPALVQSRTETAVGGPLSLPRAVRESAVSQAVPLAQANLAALLIDAGEPERAGELLRSAIASANPMVVPLAQASLGALFLQQGDLAQARDPLRSAVQSDNPFASQHAHVTLGWLLYLSDEPEEARETLERALEFSNPEVVLRAGYLLGLMRATEGDFEAAAEMLQAAADSRHPVWAPLARVDQGACWAETGDYERARTVLTEIAHSGHPEQAPRAADLLGDVLTAQAEWEEAEQAYQKAIDSGHPVWASIARMDLAVLLTALDDERGLALLARIAGSDDPGGAPRAGALLGDALAARGDWEGAEAAYRKAINSGHEQWAGTARVDLALMLADIGEIERAEDLLAEEAETGSQLAETARSFHGMLIIHRGDVDRGRELLEQAVRSDSAEAADLASIGLARLAADEGQVDEAAAHFDAVLVSRSKVAPEMAPLARAHLGALRLRQGEVDRALEVAVGEAAASGRPTEVAAALVDQGEYLLDAGDSSVAQLYLRAALEMCDPETSPRARCLLGVALLAEHDLEGARETLVEALATGDSATEPRVRRYLGSALAQLHRWSEARAVLLPLARADTEPDVGDRAQALVILGQLAVLEGRSEESREYLGRASASSDPDARARARAVLRDAGLPAEQRVPAPAPPTVAGSRSTPAPELPALPSGTSAGMTPVPEEPVSAGKTLLHDLPPALLVLLGRAAEGEGLPGEARYWLEKAIAVADPGTDDTVRTRAELLLTALRTEQVEDDNRRASNDDLSMP
ncbi:tetratricopeptide repeat protein [Streptomyces sp. NPDC057621]|uniref:tetratricopeptide repeat protein n=1 Tax=Streptomyces sp. NPDC057621 TaxID=3346186 RepID=UPI0036C96684